MEEERRTLVVENGTLEVTRNGEIYRNGYKLKQKPYSKTGYLYIPLGNKNYLVHRLVASAYIQPLKRGDRSIQVHHINEDKTDNRVENLKVMTMQEHQHEHKQIYPIEKVCVVCGKTYIPHKTKRKRSQTCSTDCWKALMRIKNEKRMRKISQYSLSGNLIQEWTCARDIQNALGICESNINKCCNGHIRTYKGYVWRYTNG